jgi:photosynthetic reaction center cytochrome c subunit
MTKRRLLLALPLVVVLAGGCERTHTQQWGFRGTGLVQLKRPADIAALDKNNKAPKPLRAAKTDGPRAADEYQNLQVLNDLSKQQLARLMISIKDWVAPEEGCGFCHNAPDYASDAKYTKRVAREMLRMVRHINTDWTQHVDGTGVTCFTCHRGKAQPARTWYLNPEIDIHGNSRIKPRVPLPTKAASRTTLNTFALNDFLYDSKDIRIVGQTALQTGNRHSIVQAKETYALMMVMAESLGVNCDFCHNTRSMTSWNQSTPQRVTAWYGIRMVRDLNNTFIAPLAPMLPAERLGPMEDTPKIYCATCHQGSNKPLGGTKWIADYPELVGTPAARPEALPAPVQAATSMTGTPTAP